MKQNEESIFINYRRSDTITICDLLDSDLRRIFGQKSVFRDVKTVGGGTHFPSQIQEAIARCKIGVVLIGDRWLDATDENNNRRLEDVHDYVRTEIEALLERYRRDRVPVLPILVQNAQIPAAEKLPASLQLLVEMDALRLRPEPEYNGTLQLIVQAIAHYVPFAVRPKPLERLYFIVSRASGSVVGILGVAFLVYSVITWLNPGFGEQLRTQLLHFLQHL